MTNALCALYAVELLLVAWYLLSRVGLAFTARGCFLGVFWLLFGLPHFYYRFVLEPPLFERISYALILMWPAVIAGIEIAWRAAPEAARVTERNRREWRRGPAVVRPSADRALVLAIEAAIVVLVFFTIYDNIPGKLARFVMTSGTNEIAALRGIEGGSRFHWYNVVMAAVAPFLSFAALARAMRRRDRASCALAATIVLLVAIGKAGLLNKGSLPIYLAQLCLVPVVASRLRVRLRVVAIAIALLGVMVYPFYYHYLGGLSVSEYLRVYFLNRILLAPYYGMFSYFSTFPDAAPYALGRNISVVNTLFYGDASYVPAMLLFARKVGNYLGSFNGAFIAEAWADFGYYGVIAESVILGLALAIADMWVFSRKKSAEGIAAVVTIVSGVLVLSATALQTALFSGGLLLVPFLVIMLRAVRVPRFALSARVPRLQASP